MAKGAGRPRVRKLGSPTQFIIDNWAASRPDLDPSNYLFLVHVSRLGRLVEQLHDRFCRAEFGMSGVDVNVLVVLRRTQADHLPRPAELAESQIMTTGAITKQIDRLQAQGYVERQEYSGRGGGVAIAATAKGIELAERAMSAMVGDSPLGEMGRNLTREERDALALLCQKLLVTFEQA